MEGGGAPRAGSVRYQWRARNVFLLYHMLCKILGFYCLTKIISPQIYLNRGYNVDGEAWSTPASVEEIKGIEADASPTLYDAVVECRVIKTPREIALMQHINNLSSEAHFEVSDVQLSFFAVAHVSNFTGAQEFRTERLHTTRHSATWALDPRSNTTHARGAAYSKKFLSS